ncbi:hypothetical protein [Sphingopyxis sp.]|jgi:hypothetical protein|uniref:hypothetical protein n=1 Tax=Sphingopyxis sp. TaxID=1908224 RepID=UPI002DEB5CD0|nr:hypothetical protein [Sphingopyxis sp.]
MTSFWWAVLALTAPAAPAGIPSLAAWQGAWVGEGEAFGKPATAALDIGPASDPDATRLAYRLSIAGAPAYSAEGIYRVDGKGRVRGNWTDSHGRTRPVAGRVGPHEWTANWGRADVEIGRSTYRLEAPDRLVVSDSVLQDDGSWRVFAVLHYRRNKG